VVVAHVENKSTSSLVRRRKFFPKGKSYDVFKFGLINNNKFIFLVHRTMNLNNNNNIHATSCCTLKSTNFVIES